MEVYSEDGKTRRRRLSIPRALSPQDGTFRRLGVFYLVISVIVFLVDVVGGEVVGISGLLRGRNRLPRVVPPPLLVPRRGAGRDDDDDDLRIVPLRDRFTRVCRPVPGVGRRRRGGVRGELRLLRQIGEGCGDRGEREESKGRDR